MPNMLIYGGCVGRDTFEHIDGGKLIGYVARQSMISAASKPTGLLGTGELASAFQNRMLDGDIKSSLFDSIRRHAPKTDVMVFDILAERYGVHALPDGSYVTLSAELTRSGRLKSLDEKPPLIRFGTDKHFHLWVKAADNMLRTAEAVGIRDKLLLLETPWADETDTGEPVTRFRGIPAAVANEQYQRYFQHLRNAGVRSVRLPDKLAVSSKDHKWGPDPYHYAEPAYHWMRDQIQAAA